MKGLFESGKQDRVKVSNKGVFSVGPQVRTKDNTTGLQEATEKSKTWHHDSKNTFKEVQ
jgi:hypothetical protein